MFNPVLTQEKTYPLVALQQKAAQLAAEGRPVINLTIGDPVDDTFIGVRQSIEGAMATQSTCRYPRPDGDPQLRQAIADWAQVEYAVDLDPDRHILSANGTKEAIFSFALSLDFSDRELFIPSLSYPVYAASARILERPFRYLPLSKDTHFLPDLDALSPQEWAKCRLFWINSPHNPTTTIASREYLKRLLDLAEKHDFIVASDECYNDFYYAGVPASSLEFTDSDRWVVFRSLSKRSHMTGFRTGAIISRNTALMAILKKMRGPMGVGTPTFIQMAAIEAWKDRDHVIANKALYARRRETLLPALADFGFDVFGAEAGFYFWCSHPDFSTSSALSGHLLDLGLLVTPGTVFGPDGDGYIRMVYCISEDDVNCVVHRLKKDH